MSKSKLQKLTELSKLLKEQETLLLKESLISSIKKGSTIYKVSYNYKKGDKSVGFESYLDPASIKVEKLTVLDDDTTNAYQSQGYSTKYINTNKGKIEILDIYYGDDVVPASSSTANSKLVIYATDTKKIYNYLKERVQETIDYLDDRINQFTTLKKLNTDALNKIK